jgi:membrane-bound lytic murein transglycosylase MltF
MPQLRNAQQIYTKGDITLAILDLTSKQIQSEKRATTIYSVSRTIVQDRRARRRPRRDYELNSKRLTKLEEEAII